MLTSSYSPFSNITSTQLARQPRGIVLINGTAIRWTSMQVTTTTFYMADNYRVEIPLSNQPAFLTLQYLTSMVPITIKVYMGFPSNPNAYTQADLQLMIVGDVDMLDIDPLTQTAAFSGRDLTSRFIDTKTYNKYPNQTASTIATQLAQQQGLNPVITSTSDKVGTFYTDQNTLMMRETTQWDLLSFLSQQEDFVVYVEGENLIFKPRPTDSTNPFILQYQLPTILGNINSSPSFNGMTLKLKRSLTLAQGVTVKIRVPASPQTGAAFTTVVHSNRKSQSTTNNQIYSYTFPGLNKNQALARANQIIRDITIHELRLEASIPGELMLKKDSLIKLVGTGTTLDQYYYADNVTRNMSITTFDQTISAKNHNVDSQITL